MSEKMLTPKFLTQELATTAVEAVLEILWNQGIGSRLVDTCDVVILVPSMADDSPFPKWPDYPLKPALLYEHRHNDHKWKDPLDEIAQCKALQLWHDRNDDRTDIIPHLLFLTYFSLEIPFTGEV